MQDSGHNMHRLLEEYKAEAFGCDATSSSSSSALMPCAEIPASELEVRYSQDPFVSFVVKAVTALTAAFRLVQLDRCAGNIEVACLRSVGGDPHEAILGNLHKLSFSSMTGEDGVTQHHFARNGRLVASKQLLYTIGDGWDGLEPVREIKPTNYCSSVQHR